LNRAARHANDIGRHARAARILQRLGGGWLMAYVRRLAALDHPTILRRRLRRVSLEMIGPGFEQFGRFLLETLTLSRGVA
jgi:hypothetical protein